MVRAADKMAEAFKSHAEKALMRKQMKEAKALLLSYQQMGEATRWSE